MSCTKKEIDVFDADEISFFAEWIKYKTITKVVVFIARKKKLHKLGKVEEQVISEAHTIVAATSLTRMGYV